MGQQGKLCSADDEIGYATLWMLAHPLLHVACCGVGVGFSTRLKSG